MATANEIIQSKRMTVAEMVEKFRSGDYYVDDTFQRRLVWVNRQKVRLIETILIGYPIPELYIHQQPTDAISGGQKFSIVDGQQRLSALAQFVAGEWPLTSGYLDRDNQESEYSDCDWNDLPDKYKVMIFDYSLTVRTIPPVIEIDQIRKIFKRLNETDRSLNPQEIRHAEFSGEFVKLAEQIADKDFWSYWEIFTDRQIRRMADVEFVTSLMVYLKKGIITDNLKTINEIYDLYNDDYPDKKKDEQRIAEILGMIDTLFEKDDDISNFFSKTVHLYTLFVLLDQKGFIPDLGAMADRLKAFVEANRSVEKSNNLREYRRGSEQRTRSKLSREIRHEALLEFLRTART